MVTFLQWRISETRVFFNLEPCRLCVLIQPGSVLNLFPPWEGRVIINVHQLWSTVPSSGTESPIWDACVVYEISPHGAVSFKEEINYSPACIWTLRGNLASCCLPIFVRFTSQGQYYLLKSLEIIFLSLQSECSPFRNCLALEKIEWTFIWPSEKDPKAEGGVR